MFAGWGWVQFAFYQGQFGTPVHSDVIARWGALVEKAYKQLLPNGDERDPVFALVVNSRIQYKIFTNAPVDEYVEMYPALIACLSVQHGPLAEPTVRMYVEHAERLQRVGQTGSALEAVREYVKRRGAGRISPTQVLCIRHESAIQAFDNGRDLPDEFGEFLRICYDDALAIYKSGAAFDRVTGVYGTWLFEHGRYAEAKPIREALIASLRKHAPADSDLLARALRSLDAINAQLELREPASQPQPQKPEGEPP